VTVIAGRIALAAGDGLDVHGAMSTGVPVVAAIEASFFAVGAVRPLWVAGGSLL
jgi:hypothetical protein